ncbi:MAG: chorismate mutase [Planctomycetota bacterium]
MVAHPALLEEHPLPPTDELLRLRAEIDALNAELCQVLHRRARLCRAIARHKATTGLPAVDDARERAMLAALAAAPADGFEPAALDRILRAVFAESRAIVERGGAVP